MTRLFGAVQPIWIRSHKCAVDIHLEHARTCERKSQTNTTQGSSQFTSSSRPNLNAWSDNRISELLLLGSNLERDTLLSTRQLGGGREVWEPKHLQGHATYRWSHAYPLLVMMAYVSSDHRSGVAAATHSSRSSNKGWWLCCSTVAMMGIREPRGKMADSAGPEKSSMGEETSWLEVHSLPNAKVSSATMHILELGSPIRDHCSDPNRVHILLFTFITCAIAFQAGIYHNCEVIALTICNSYVEDQIRLTKCIKHRFT